MPFSVKMTTHGLSVIVPTRNRLFSLKKTLAALLKETRKHDEIIICDNSTNNNTFHYYQSIQNRTKKIRYCRVQQLGPSYARNAGILLAKNSYLAFIDDDCVVHATWRQVVHSMIKNELHSHQYSIHQGKIHYIFSKKNIFTTLFQARQRTAIKTLKLQHTKNRSTPVTFINAGNFFVHSSVIKKLQPFFNEKEFPYIGEERDLALRAELACIPIVFEPNLRVKHIRTRLSLPRIVKSGFFQGRATAKLIKLYGVDKKIAQAFGLRQDDEYGKLFDLAYHHIIPRSIQGVFPRLFAKTALRIQQITYILSREAHTFFFSLT